MGTEVIRRLSDPRYATREVVVRYCREPDRVRVVIMTKGRGSTGSSNDMDPARAFDIAWARRCRA